MGTAEEFRAAMVLFLQNRIERARALANASSTIGGRRQWHGAEDAYGYVLDFIQATFPGEGGAL